MRSRGEVFTDSTMNFTGVTSFKKKKKKNSNPFCPIFCNNSINNINNRKDKKKKKRREGRKENLLVDI